jgi:serine/threonine protein kinase
MLVLPATRRVRPLAALTSSLPLSFFPHAAHHDLKARNFVRFFNGHCKLIDFDNSRCFADEQVTFFKQFCVLLCIAV